MTAAAIIDWIDTNLVDSVELNALGEPDWDVFTNVIATQPDQWWEQLARFAGVRIPDADVRAVVVADFGQRAVDINEPTHQLSGLTGVLFGLLTAATLYLWATIAYILITNI